MAIQPYVKFLRGTIEDFNALTSYNSDTLYFITDNSKNITSLYLGSSLITSGNNDSISSLNNLTDVVITTVADKQILSYDAISKKWINIDIDSLLEDIVKRVEENENKIININTSVTNIEKLLNNKIDSDKVYTKEEVDAKILAAEHLIRKTFNTLEEAKTFAASITNPEAYIYMVASNTSETNKYAEYLYVEGELEQVGSWETTLEDYATKEEVNSLSSALGSITTRVENLEDFMNSDYFTKVDEMKADLNNVKDAVTWKEL